MVKKKIKLQTIYSIFVISFFAVAIAQLFSHQILNGEKFDEISRRNYVRIRRVNATRGMILDRKLRPIANNRPSVNLYFRPYLIKDRQNFIDFLSQNINLSSESLEKLIFDNRFRRFSEILISENLQEDTLAKIAERMNYFPELVLKVEELRSYHMPNHFTGFVGKINEQEFNQFKSEDYTINSKIGKSGLEKYYEGLLAGKSGYEVLQVDALGRSLNLFKHNIYKRPVNGFNIVLTIDIELQEFIQNIFPKNKSGAVVVMNPKTGALLAYNSFPEYDQNWFARGITTAQWEYLRDHENKPLIDRVTMGTYPPGSTFKTVSAAFGLEKNYVTEHTRLAFCDGGMQIGNRYFKCWNKYGHGRTNVLEAMAVSCDVYYYDLSARFNLDEFSAFTYSNFILDKTGIDLPSERAGFFPNSEWYRNRLGRFFSVVGLKANLVIGQGEVLTSPLAVCAYYSALANDGLWKTPFFYDRAFNDNGVLDEIFTKRVIKELPYSEKTLKLIQQSLYETVYRSDGTGRFARVPGAVVFGKTGSSENPHGDLTHASFAGYAMWDNEPEIAFYIIIENAGHGGSVAGPLVQKIIQFYQDNIR